MTAPEDSPRSDCEHTRAEFERLLDRAPHVDHYILVLYVSGTTSRSVQAVANVRGLCERHLPGRYELEVVDIYQDPGRLAEDRIVAAPTLLKRFPMPPVRLVGNLEDPGRVLLGLNLLQKDQVNRVRS